MSATFPPRPRFPVGKIRALIVDDEPLARSRVRELLATQPDVEVTGECGNGREAIAAIQSDRPDLVYLDVQMPEVTGFEVLEALEPAAAPAVVFVTAFDEFARAARSRCTRSTTSSSRSTGSGFSPRCSGPGKPSRLRREGPARRAAGRPARRPRCAAPVPQASPGEERLADRAAPGRRDRLDRIGGQLRTAPCGPRATSPAGDDDDAGGAARSRAVRPDPSVHHRQPRAGPRAGAVLPWGLRGAD